MNKLVLIAALAGGYYMFKGGMFGKPKPSMISGQQMSRGTVLYSPDKKTKLVFQDDGNLVLYTGNTAMWSALSAPNSSPADMVALQNDGHLVGYSGNVPTFQTYRIDASQVGSYNRLKDKGGFALYVHNEGYFDVMDALGRVWWTSAFDAGSLAGLGWERSRGMGASMSPARRLRHYV